MQIAVSALVCTIFGLVALFTYKAPPLDAFHPQTKGGATEQVSGTATGDQAAAAGDRDGTGAASRSSSRTAVPSDGLIQGPTALTDGKTTIRITTRNGKITGVAVQGGKHVTVRKK